MTIILDGAMGTELTRRGVDTSLPLWSAIALDAAPDVVVQIHRDYLDAGARVITTNTFRTNVRALAKAGIAHRARELTFRAVALARRAVMEWRQGQGCAPAGSSAADLPILVAASIAPVEDCYSPELVPSDAELAEEHASLAHNLAAAGVDLILVETQNTIREAVAAARAAHTTGKPLWVSFTLDDENRLLSGELLPDAVRAVLPFKPRAILVNCIPVKQVAPALKLLRSVAPSHVALGAYANVGHVDEGVGWTLTNAVSPDAYAEAAREWRDLGATIIGGCCGTTPEHIRAVSAQLGER
ncbi:homocysteine S-methyltransferase family protein [Candidatus Roseilinea sp. NK_OTU-006]|uniref:homocysteine S-methyltransferase family protein n=1 Tax=Candidatus Roseilinea sp. NK_OTU-006 TaxID=2704250 RepID=UPI002A5A51FD|nr:homocysteine S-methyltransferase family protein [Candidatus Roseilinea sp. NK_OTU-006]